AGSMTERSRVINMSKSSEDEGSDSELMTSTITPPASAENACRFGIRSEEAKVDSDVRTTIRLVPAQ
ncbi:hypothetical protein, partial [Bradyrhizobium ottawaense]|uniref:hypothetical protein n=1 Tax=Bradyrhizobium ottawaense TaxID=931866 RepID=UPI003BA3E079